MNKQNINNYKQLLKQVAILHVDAVREMERLRRRKYNHEDIFSLILKDKEKVKIDECIENIISSMKEIEGDKEIISRAYYLKEIIGNLKHIRIKNLNSVKNNSIKDMLEIEVEANYIYNIYIIELISCMFTLATVSEITGIPVPTLKTAYQKKQLKNTRKVGNSCLIHLEEVRRHWNLEVNKNSVYYSEKNKH